MPVPPARTARAVFCANSKPSTTASADRDDKVSMGKLVRKVDMPGYLIETKEEEMVRREAMGPRV